MKTKGTARERCEARTFFSYLFSLTFPCFFFFLFSYFLFTPASSLHTQNFHPLPQLLGQNRRHWVKCISRVEQVPPYFPVYQRAVPCCGLAAARRATSAGWRPGRRRCHRRAWAELLFPGERCSGRSVWLGTTGAPAPRAAAGHHPRRHPGLLLLGLGGAGAPPVYSLKFRELISEMNRKPQRRSCWHDS